MNEPQVISLDDIAATAPADAVTRVRIARAITKQRTGSNLMLGAAWMNPGDRSNNWSSREENDVGPRDHWYGPVDEVYYIVSGQLRLTWDEGQFDLKPNDCVYLAPGWTYSVENVGEHPAFFVYAMTPTPA